MIFSLIKQKLIASALGIATVSAATVSPTVPAQTISALTVQAPVAVQEVAQPVAEELAAPAEGPSPEEVRAEIIRQAKEYGVNVDDALRIAKCESTFRWNAANSHSSAKGVYQFINGTWEWIGAEGHQYDYKENISQFMKWYPRYPQWWECK